MSIQSPRPHRLVILPRNSNHPCCYLANVSRSTQPHANALVSLFCGPLQHSSDQTSETRLTRPSWRRWTSPLAWLCWFVSDEGQKPADILHSEARRSLLSCLGLSKPLLARLNRERFHFRSISSAGDDN